MQSCCQSELYMTTGWSSCFSIRPGYRDDTPIASELSCLPEKMYRADPSAKICKKRNSNIDQLSTTAIPLVIKLRFRVNIPVYDNSRHDQAHAVPGICMSDTHQEHELQNNLLRASIDRKSSELWIQSER